MIVDTACQVTTVSQYLAKANPNDFLCSNKIISVLFGVGEAPVGSVYLCKTTLKLPGASLETFVLVPAYHDKKVGKYQLLGMDALFQLKFDLNLDLGYISWAKGEIVSTSPKYRETMQIFSILGLSESDLVPYDKVDKDIASATTVALNNGTFLSVNAMSLGPRFFK